jgi:O-antigen/teichoic acid export membrane protein
MQTQDIYTIKHKTVSGVVALTTRTMLLQIIGFVSMFLLTLFLDPSVFGVFYVVSSITSFLNYVSDIGLAAALVQKKEPLTDEDYSSTFTVQQILVGSVTIIALLLSPTIGKFYHFDQSGIYLLQALIISFFLASLKTIPSVILERRLDFHLLVIPQLIETIVYNGISVVLAWLGFGIMSFMYAVLARGIVGLISMYIIAPWKPKFGINKIVIKRLLSYGVPFQLNSFLALLKDDLLTIVLGSILPIKDIGYIGWAKKWAEVPLRLIMDSIIRVTFPTFSRIQESREMLGKAIEKTLFGISLFLFPISIIMISCIAQVVASIPKYSKWEPALFSFGIFTISSLLAGLSTPLTNALNAVGKIKLTLLLMIFWTFLTWITVMIGIRFYGFNGVAIGLLIVSFTAPLTIFATKSIADFSIFKILKGPIAGSLTMVIIFMIAIYMQPLNIQSCIVVSFIGLLSYIVILQYVDIERIHGFMKDLRLWKR